MVQNKGKLQFQSKAGKRKKDQMQVVKINLNRYLRKYKKDFLGQIERCNIDPKANNNKK